MENNEIASILIELAKLIKSGKGECLKDDALKLCALFYAYKFPYEAMEGVMMRRFDEYVSSVHKLNDMKHNMDK
jgi:hypothetical protein